MTDGPNMQQAANRPEGDPSPPTDDSGRSPGPILFAGVLVVLAVGFSLLTAF